MAEKNILLHVHIFKNAGSSFDDAIKRFFGDTFVDHRDDSDIVKGKMEYLEEYLNTHQEIRAFSSHSIYFLPKNTDTYNFFPVYFLRHPIDRIRSVYSFEKKQIPATTQGSKKAKELSFQDYVSWYMEDTSPATIRNLQTIFLSGERSNALNIDKKFELALRNLNNSHLVGIVDRYDESMVVFEEYLKDFFPNIDLSYIRKNITDTNLKASPEEKAEKLLSELDVETRNLVKEKNDLDIKLYAEAKIQLDDKIAKIGNFEQKLMDFKNRCLLKLVQINANKNSFQDIITLLDPILKTEGGNAPLFLAMANAHKELKQYNKALAIYEVSMQKFPNNPWAYFHEAEMYHLLGGKNKSEKLFNDYKNRFKDNKKLIAFFRKYV